MYKTKQMYKDINQAHPWTAVIQMVTYWCGWRKTEQLRTGLDFFSAPKTHLSFCRVHAGSFHIAVIHWTVTWTTGSLTCVCDHSYACIYTWGLGTLQTVSQHNISDLENSFNFSCSPEGVQTWVTECWVWHYQLSHPVTPKVNWLIN